MTDQQLEKLLKDQSKNIGDQISRSLSDALNHINYNQRGSNNSATGGHNGPRYDSYSLRGLQNSINLAEKAHQLYSNIENIPKAYGKEARIALSEITKGFKEFMRDGKVDFTNKNGEFDPARFSEFIKQYNQGAMALAGLVSKIEELDNSIGELPGKIDEANAALKDWEDDDNNKNLTDKYNAFLDDIKKGNVEGANVYQTYMRKLTIEGPVTAQMYFDRLNKAQKEQVLHLQEINDDYKKRIDTGKQLEKEVEALNEQLIEDKIKRAEAEEEKDRHLRQSVIDNFYKNSEKTFGWFFHNIDLADIAKSDRNLAWQVMQKNFQVGNSSLTSNIAKGFGSAAEKLLPRVASKLGPIMAVLTFIAGLVKRGVDTWLEYEEKALEVTKTMGMGAHDAHGYQQDLMWMTHKYAAQYGLEKEALLNIQAASNEATGRNAILNEEQLIDAVAGKKFMGDQTYAAMMKSFEMAGGSADSAMKYGMMTMERAAKMGLNMQKASAEFAKNMGMVNKYSFKSGVDGISKMTLLSQQLKFNLESMSSLFDKAATIEGSIDVAAHMQMLGGTYATQFGNPMRLLYNSLNNVEEMTQTVIDTVVSKGRFNEKTGTVDINNLDRAFIKEMSKIIGVSQEDLFNMASRKVFISEVSKHMATDLTEAQRGQLANMAQFSQTQGWIVSYLDANNELVTKQIDEIHAEDMDAINKGRMYDTVEDNVENIWLLLKEKYRDEAATATSLKAKKAGLDNAYDLALGGNRAVAGSMGGISHIADRWSSRHNDAFFYKDGTVHPLAPDDNVYAFKGAGQVDPGAGRFYNSSITNVRMAEQMTQSFIKGSTNTLASAVSNSMRSMNSSSNSSVRFRETENVYSSIESSVAKAVTNTLKAGAFNADVNVNGTINLKFPDGSSVDMIKQLQKPEVVRMLSSIIAQQLARLDNKGATPALGTNALKGTAI